MKEPTELMGMHPAMYLASYDSYEDAREGFEWHVPDRFNIGVAAVDQHADVGDDVALYWENVDGPSEAWTFDDFRLRSNQFCTATTSMGLGPGDVVAVFTPQVPQALVSHLGTWKIGGVTLPLANTFGPDGVSYRLADSGAKAVVVHRSNLDVVREVRDDLPDLEVVLVVGDATLRDDELSFSAVLDGGSETFDPVPTSADDDAVVIYTSGTTGEPKGVLHAHRGLYGHLVGTQCSSNLDVEGINYTPVDWAWLGSLFYIMFTLYWGQTMVGANFGRFDPEEQYQLWEKYEITDVHLPPTAINMLRQVDDSGYDLSLETIGAGGEMVPPAALEWAEQRGYRVLEGYGQSEATSFVQNCHAWFPSRPGSMGRAVPGHVVEIIDEDGEVLGPNEVGEIALKRPDPVLFKGYLNRPEATEATRLGEWHLTGDLGRKDEDGYFWFEGRKDDVIITSGYRIGPEEIENVLVECEGVVEAAVIGVPDDVRGTIVKAFVEVADESLETDEFRRRLQQSVKDDLAKYAYPREIEFVREFPMTSTGKIQRNKLLERETST